MTIKRRQWHLLPAKYHDTLFKVESVIFDGDMQNGPDTIGYVAGIRITVRETDYNARRGSCIRRMFFPDWSAKYEMERERDDGYGTRWRRINVSYLATDESIVLRDLTFAKMSAELAELA